ncbi:T9SS type A sorting domain-containing protein [Pseudotamlana carrageenivorans]|uniref:Secretion system C-terminal sorting domain-containing protein n=1 Tax=Pseudotamlana carrageenivorans TaxID=2069432 RepID=A0A2I7SMS1_9FLAO|nr:T9SS type A sorting domain-containing protein [Tamlana carrageenivorans]AUS07164.1 hypothetical protein C1A40_17760 [Tamlana carrageenivorans]
MKQKLLILGITLLTLKVTYSQCAVAHITEQFSSNIIPSVIGQSFTAECDGTLASFQIYASEIGTLKSGTLNIYDGNTNSGTPIYTQIYPEIVVTNIDNPIVFNITGSVLLLANNQYSFQVSTNLNYFLGYPNPYTSGTAWVNSKVSSLMDLSFSVSISDNALGAEAFNKDNKISIFPNPASEFITISNMAVSENYSILNALGQEIISGITGNNEIDIRSLNNGLYFLKFEKGAVLKFIKK